MICFLLILQYSFGAYIAVMTFNNDTNCSGSYIGSSFSLNTCVNLTSISMSSSSFIATCNGNILTLTNYSNSVCSGQSDSYNYNTTKCNSGYVNQNGGYIKASCSENSPSDTFSFFNSFNSQTCSGSPVITQFSGPNNFCSSSSI